MGKMMIVLGRVRRADVMRALFFGLGAFILDVHSISLAAERTESDPGDDPSAIVAEAEDAFREGDVVAAMNLLQPAAENGFVPAQVQLAYYLDYAEEDKAAFDWYRAAAEAGSPEAQYHLGRMYGAGEGTDLDPDLARQWFEQAALQNDPEAIRVMAVSYEKGGAMTGISFEEAVLWLERGAAIEDAWSLRRLSDAYLRGELGLRIDRKRAEALRVRADNAGVPG